MARLLLGALLFIASSGCALTNTTVVPPQGPVGANLSGGKNRLVAVVVPFADDRKQTRCGMKKNGYNMDTASVLCGEPPAQFLATLLASELRSAGFEVGSNAAQAGALKLEGRLLQFFVEPKVGFVTFTPEADIHVRLVASSASGLLAERDFYVKGEEVSMVGTDENMQRASDAAVRRIVREMVAAVLALLDRYPTVATSLSPAPRT